MTKEQELRNEAWVNHGFREVKRLAGNVGYLKVDRLLPTWTAADTANAAMKFLSDVEALIIDLRDNRGGSPEMIQLLCTYLFESGARVHLNDFQRRGQLVESYTLASVPDTRFAGTPVFILTSHHTFSGAEELAYDLQSLQRATIAGEATGGGANPGRVFQLPQDFLVFVPTGLAINPVTKTNWEGVGVKPDIQVPSAVAVDVAHLAALRAIRHFPHLEPDQEQEVQESIKSLEKRVVPLLITRITPVSKRSAGSRRPSWSAGANLTGKFPASLSTIGGIVRVVSDYFKECVRSNFSSPTRPSPRF